MFCLPGVERLMVDLSFPRVIYNVSKFLICFLQFAGSSFININRSQFQWSFLQHKGKLYLLLYPCVQCELHNILLMTSINMALPYLKPIHTHPKDSYTRSTEYPEHMIYTASAGPYKPSVSSHLQDIYLQRLPQTGFLYNYVPLRTRH